MPVEFALDFLLVIDGFEKVLLVADGLRELLCVDLSGLPGCVLSLLRVP